MYYVFSGEHYYPAGGWGDFIGEAETLDDALALAAKFQGDWYEVVSVETLSIVAESHHE